MKTRIPGARVALPLFSLALITAGCSSDRTTNTRIVGPRDAGMGVARDGGPGGGPRDAGPMGGGCTANPNGCAQFELIGAPPACTCLNVCETGYIYNNATMVCDPVMGGMTCGNNIVEGTEECDDGNTIDGDGCSSTCQNEGMMGMLCADACDRLVMCTEMDCPGTVDRNACIAQCEPDPVGFQAELILTLTCAEINQAICIQMQETNAGDACMADTDCNAGTLQPFCIQATDMNGMPSGWEGGYCTAIGCRADSECGTNKLCVTIDMMGTTACFQGCDVGTNGAGVCRMGYQCPDLSQGMNIGACIPACTDNADCGAGQTCNTMTGQCM